MILVKKYSKIESGSMNAWQPEELVKELLGYLAQRRTVLRLNELEK